MLIGLVAIGIGISSECGFWGDLVSAQFRLWGVFVQWSMGFYLSLKYLMSKGEKAIPLALSRYDTPMKK